MNRILNMINHIKYDTMYHGDFIDDVHTELENLLDFENETLDNDFEKFEIMSALPSADELDEIENKVLELNKSDDLTIIKKGLSDLLVLISNKNTEFKNTRSEICNG